MLRPEFRFMEIITILGIKLREILEARVGIEPSGSLQTRKLFFPRSDKSFKNSRNGEVRYTAGTRDTPLALWNSAVFLLHPL